VQIILKKAIYKSAHSLMPECPDIALAVKNGL